jgi:hypothetical protein
MTSPRLDRAHRHVMELQDKYLSAQQKVNQLSHDHSYVAANQSISNAATQFARTYAIKLMKLSGSKKIMNERIENSKKC